MDIPRCFFPPPLLRFCVPLAPAAAAVFPRDSEGATAPGWAAPVWAAAAACFAFEPDRFPPAVAAPGWAAPGWLDVAAATGSAACNELSDRFRPAEAPVAALAAAAADAAGVFLLLVLLLGRLPLKSDSLAALAPRERSREPPAAEYAASKSHSVAL